MNDQTPERRSTPPSSPSSSFSDLVAAVVITVVVTKSRGAGGKKYVAAHLRFPENNLSVVQNAAYEQPSVHDAAMNDETQA